MPPKNPSTTLIERVAREARSGKASRRDFMAMATAAGLSTTAISSIWSTAAAAAPQRGGTFRFGIHEGNTSDSHDPGTYLTRQMIYLAHQYRSYLTLIEPDNSLGPDLATSWGANDDASIWTFELTTEATFHDGRKVTANDIVASMNHHRGDDSGSAAKALLEGVVDVRADGDHTVVFELSAPNADLPWLMTDYHLAICPANEDGSIEWRSGMGSGPYKIVSGEPGQRWSLERHDGWHIEGAYFDNLEAIMLIDAAARQTALVTGEVDAVSAIDLKTLALLRRDPNVVVEDVPSAGAITMPMLCDTPPYDDPKVRNALKYAMDREELIQKIAFGAATIGNDFHLSPAQPYWPNDIEQRAYDPDMAKFLLKEAGQEGLNVTLSSAESVFPGAIDAAVLYSEQAKRAGINVTVEREPSDGYYSNVWLKKPFCMVSWGARPTPDVMFTLAYQKGAAWNESRWANERFNELLLQAKGELNDQLRSEMYREMCVLARDDGGTILPFFNNFVYARRANVHRGDGVSASWELDGSRGPSRWWFA